MKRLIPSILLVIICFFVYSNKSQAQPLTNPVASLSGVVLNELTHQPIGVELEVFNDAGERVNRVKSNAKTGNYFITGLEPGKKYFIRNVMEMEKADKYFKHRFEIDLPKTDKYAEYSKDFVLKPLEKDLALNVRTSPFEYNSPELRSGIDIFMKRIYETLRENPRIKFEIVCYPENDNNPSENKSLTDKRAVALKEYLVKNGIKDSRITTLGNSNTDPKNPPPTTKHAKGKKYKGPTYIVIKGT